MLREGIVPFVPVLTFVARFKPSREMVTLASARGDSISFVTFIHVTFTLRIANSFGWHGCGVGGGFKMTTGAQR